MFEQCGVCLEQHVTVARTLAMAASYDTDTRHRYTHRGHDVTPASIRMENPADRVTLPQRGWLLRRQAFAH